MCENFKGNSYDSENILSAIKRKKSGIYPSKYEDILSYVRCFKDIATKGILQNFFFFLSLLCGICVRCRNVAGRRSLSIFVFRN